MVSLLFARNEPLFRGLDSPVEARLAAPVGEKTCRYWDTGPAGRILINETYALTLIPDGVKEMRIYCFEKGLEVKFEAIEKLDVHLNARVLHGPLHQPPGSDESDVPRELPVVW